MSVSRERTQELILELRRLCADSEAEGVYNGHDQMMARQVALLIYLTNRPKTADQVVDMTPIVPQMNADLGMLYRRLYGNPAQ